MENSKNSKKGGFRYVYTREKAEEYQKLSYEQRLEWLEKMSRFLFNFMPQASKDFSEKLRRGEI
jgi:predicted transcriptional regulator